MNETSLEKIAQFIANELKKESITYSNLNISLSLARKIVYKVEQKASEIGVNAVVSIVNSAARPVITECMDNSYIASFDIASNKAFTCVSLKMPTSALKKLSYPRGPLYGIQNTHDSKIVIFGGGEPLIYNGVIIGGIGVSGGTEEQDTFLASYGAEIFNSEIRKTVNFQERK